MGYAFGDLLGDIGKWLLLGILLAALIGVLVPTDLEAVVSAGELGSLLLMLIIGVPLYICASASTPVAAALVLKGISPGAALVFLLAGPATNAATLAVLLRFLGRRVTALYLLLICICSLGFGWLVNRIYEYSGLDLAVRIAQVEAASSWFEQGAAVLVLLLIARNLVPKRLAPATCR